MKKLLTLLRTQRQRRQEARLMQINRPCSPQGCTVNRAQIFKRYNYRFRSENLAKLSEAG